MNLVEKNPLKITWISFTVLDITLHKTSRIEILRHLAKRGHQVHLIAVRSARTSVGYSKNTNMQITLIPLRYIPVISPFLFGLIIFFYLPFYVIKNRPNFIITDPSTLIIGFFWKPILSKIFDFKAILDIRSTPIGDSNLKTLNFNISVFIAKVIFEGVTIITNGMKKEVCKRFNINPELIGVWSDAASTELFAYEKNIRYGLELRKKFGLSHKFIILYHGNLSRKRGILECVRAIMFLKKEYPDIFLFLLGSGPAIPDIKSLIQKNGLQEYIILHGLVDYEEVPKYIAMSDVCIVPLPNLPIWQFQCPLKLLEYLAMKRTVIITDIKANRDIVRDNKCAIYIPSCNYILISRAMIYAYKNKEKLKEWGELGQKIINKEYNWNKSTKDIVKYLLEVQNKSSKVRHYE